MWKMGVLKFVRDCDLAVVYPAKRIFLPVSRECERGSGITPMSCNKWFQLTSYMPLIPFRAIFFLVASRANPIQNLIDRFEPIQLPLLSLWFRISALDGISGRSFLSHKLLLRIWSLCSFLLQEPIIRPSFWFQSSLLYPTLWFDPHPTISRVWRFSSV